MLRPLRSTAKRYEGDLRASQEGYAQATKIFVKTFGYDHIDTIKCQSDHAEVAAAAGNIDFAEDLAHRARDSANKLFNPDGEEGSDHVLVRETQAILAQVASQRGRHYDSLKWLEPVVEVEARMNFPPRNKATMLLVKARQKRAAGAPAEEVKALADEALELRRRVFRPEDECAEVIAFLQEQVGSKESESKDHK